MDTRYESVWDALLNAADETNDLEKRSGYLILIWAR